MSMSTNPFRDRSALFLSRQSILLKRLAPIISADVSLGEYLGSIESLTRFVGIWLRLARQFHDNIFVT